MAFKKNIGMASFGLFLALPLTALAADDTEEKSKTVLDASPLLSARAGGMGGAISTIADGAQAPFYNPANIGRLNEGDKGDNLLRLLHFPYAGVSANENARKLNKDFDTQNASESKAVSDSVLAAHAGKRQYARANFLTGLILGRVGLFQYEDIQIAAVKKRPEENPDSVRTSYRNLQGTGLGFSVANQKQTIHLGAFSSYQYYSAIEQDVPYSSLSTSQGRSDLTKGATRYEGTTTNVGLTWVMANFGRPTLAVVTKNVAGAYYSLRNDQAHPELPKSKKEKEDYTLGFSVSPRLGKQSEIHFIIEGQHLTDTQTALNKKFHTGLELNLLGHGSDALFSLRSGYNLAGLSYGASLNLALVQFEVSSYAEDVGIANNHLAENRLQAVFSVNVLDRN